MKLPGFVEYQAAIQSPQICFTDPELKACSVETDSIDLPRPRSGGFALTYHLTNSYHQWAVRCFHKDVPDLQERYAAISSFIAGHQVPILTSIDYQDQGILVQGHRYPITKMEWIEGRTLCFEVESKLQQPHALLQLTRQIEHLAQTLEGMGVAHGDLQHGNIIVTSKGELRLVDYDGFYVPALHGRPSANAGLPNYQHPRRRADDFNPYMDRFSLIVLYLGLAGTAAKPELWKRYSQGGNNVLLTQDDFLRPDMSPVLRELEAVSGLGPMVRTFRSICKSDIDQIPCLSDFVARPSSVAPSPTKSAVTVQSQLSFPIVRADDIGSLVAHEGDVVEVVGFIEAIHEAYTKHGKPYAFLNCGKFWNRAGCFTVVLWSEALSNFTSTGHRPHSYQGQWISVTGLVTIYREGRYGPAPQIMPLWPGEIRILTEKEARARSRLTGLMSWNGYQPSPFSGSRQAQPLPPNSGLAPGSRPISRTEVEAHLETLYGQRGQYSRPVSQPISPKSSHSKSARMATKGWGSSQQNAASPSVGSQPPSYRSTNVSQPTPGTRFAIAIRRLKTKLRRFL